MSRAAARSADKRSRRWRNCTRAAKPDRIVVVAHSLGSVVAYDMLRAYYSRVRHNMPDRAAFGAGFDALDGFDPATGGYRTDDSAPLDRGAMRDAVRAISELVRRRSASGW